MTTTELRAFVRAVEFEGPNCKDPAKAQELAREARVRLTERETGLGREEKVNTPKAMPESFVLIGRGARGT